MDFGHTQAIAQEEYCFSLGKTFENLDITSVLKVSNLTRIVWVGSLKSEPDALQAYLDEEPEPWTSCRGFLG